MNIFFVGITTMCIVFIILTLFMYLYKGRIKTIETRIYTFLIVVNLLSLLLEMFSHITIFLVDKSNIIKTLFLAGNKVYVASILVWFLIFNIYVLLVTSKYQVESEEYKAYHKKIRLFNVIVMFIAGIFIFIFPLQIIFVNETSAYTNGIGINYVLIPIGFSCFLFWLIKCFINLNKLKEKRFLPIIICILLMVITAIVQSFDRSYLIIVTCQSIVTILMYHTIENPDLKMIEQLNMAKSEAERANMAKSDFLASMSHEIRTPLNAITGFSHAILNDETLSSESLEYANDIVKASNTLLEIVGGVLDVSKIESNKMDIVEVLYNPREEIEDLVKIVNARLGEKPVVFNYKVAEDLPYQLYGDRANMKKVVTNLLTNAVKYTAKGQIFFNVRCINKNDICHVVISVQDTGMGIKEEHISKLFTKFERLEVEKNTTAEGTGLGLAITKRLVELMGGKINVKSQYGVGSIFMTQIPQRIAMMSKPLTDTQILSTVELKNKRLKEEANIDGQRILIVDDNALNIKVAKIALKNFNLVLDEVESGEECLEKIKSGERYDLILMDIMMPGLSGEETFIELKKIVGFNTPVIALTADAVSGSKEKYLSQGFTSYISKPFSPEEIKLELAKIFKTKR